MKIILLNARPGRSVTLNVNSWVKAVASLCVLGIPLSIGITIGVTSADNREDLVAALDLLESQLDAQKNTLNHGRSEAIYQLEAYSSKLADMQARVVRLDALGERIADIAGLTSGEFDFGDPPALGGPNETLAEPTVQADVDLFYQELDSQLVASERQLGILRTMMTDRLFKRENTMAGLPAAKGWLSSAYGLRRDPFHGKKAWHKGIDVAGQEGSPVIAVAGGIVTRSGTKAGYGQLVEVDHGNELVARYAHNKENIVKIGDLVKKGQVIAYMGSTGRSTGPHVHFEVYKNGRHVDPASYIRRTIR